MENNRINFKKIFEIIDKMKKGEPAFNCTTYGPPPIVDDYSKILILGIYPENSNEPHYNFWKYALSYFGDFSELIFLQKKEKLLNSNIAIANIYNSITKYFYFVLHHEDRVVINLESFLDNYKSIKHVLFDGEEPYKVIKRHSPDLFKSNTIKFHIMPSTTGPENKFNKRKEWNELFNKIVCR